MSSIQICTPNIGSLEETYMVKAVRSTFVSSVGPFVDDFEEGLRKEGDFGAATVVSAGTVALKLALEVAGVKRNDLVIVPTLSFIATANAVSHAGAEPWFFDVDRENWALDLALLESQLASCKQNAQGELIEPKTSKVVRAIVPVMIMGAALDLDAYAKLARKYGLKIIVDAAAAIGVRGAEGKKLGAYDLDAVIYSFNGNKTITTGGGGAILSNDRDFVSRARHLATTARVGQNYDHDAIGYNYRMTNVQAALGLAQLERLDEFLKAKARFALAYSRIAAQFDCLSEYPQGRLGQSTHWFSGFYYTGDDLTMPERFIEYMNRNDVALRKFWKPLHQQMPYKDHLRTGVGVAEEIWSRIFTLPVSTNLTESELEKVEALSREFWGSVCK